MNSNTVLVDLRPDRTLLDPSFDGYKLSLDSVPVQRKVLEKGAYFLEVNDDQFSFIHTKLFSLHNHLYVNPHHSNSVYFIDKDWKIQKVSVNELSRLQEIQHVCTIERKQHKKSYNASISFASADIAVISDGAGSFYIANIVTKDNGDEEWIVQYSNLFKNETGFILYDSNLADDSSLHIAFVYIEEKDKKEEDMKSGLFFTTIEWIALIKDETKIWDVRTVKKMSVDGSVDYVALERNSSGIYVISDKIPKWKFDSEVPVEEKMEVEKEPEKKIYSWSQTSDEITVNITLPDETSKTDLKITVDDLEIEVKNKEEVIMSGKLFQRLNKECTSWTFEKSKLEIQLTKHESGLMWKEFILDDKTGEEMIDPSLVAEVHQKLSHLCSDKEEGRGQVSFNSQQLEDCDTISCDTTALVRIAADREITHEISLSSIQWLFKIHRDANKTPAICLRHDVDACVWQFEEAEDKKWPCKHVGTFSALGYVQASKTQRKFLTAPTDFSYAVICEAVRHVYVYRQPAAVNGELRNRTSGKKVEAVAKQQLINLEENELILGIHANNAHLYILTESKILLLAINE